MRFDAPKFRNSSPWIWNLGIALLAVLAIFMLLRQPGDDTDEKIAFICKGLEQGADQAAIDRCVAGMKK